MKITLDWGPMLPLAISSESRFIYTVDLSNIPTKAGVYIFGRIHSKKFAALYVGQATNLCRRVGTQLNNLRLMRHIEHAPTGQRVLLTGVYHTTSEARRLQVLDIVERGFIRHFLTEGHDLVNIRGTTLREHAIYSDGKHPKRFFPRELFVER